MGELNSKFNKVAEPNSPVDQQSRVLDEQKGPAAWGELCRRAEAQLGVSMLRSPFDKLEPCDVPQQKSFIICEFAERSDILRNV